MIISSFGNPTRLHPPIKFSINHQSWSAMLINRQPIRSPHVSHLSLYFRSASCTIRQSCPRSTPLLSQLASGSPPWTLPHQVTFLTFSIHTFWTLLWQLYQKVTFSWPSAADTGLFYHLLWINLKWHLIPWSPPALMKRLKVLNVPFPLINPTRNKQ